MSRISRFKFKSRFHWRFKPAVN